MGSRLRLRTRDASGGGLDPAAAALIARMSSAPTAARQTLISQTIATLRAGGVWDKIDVFWMLAAHDSQAAKLNWKADAYNVTEVSAPTFTADGGFASTGANYLRGNWIPSTNGVAITQNSGHVAAFSGTERAAAARFMGGANSAGSRLIGFYNRNTTDLLQSYVNSNNYDLPSNSAQGLFVASRTGANAISVYRKGGLVGSATTVSTGLPAQEVYLLCVNNVGTAAAFSTDVLRFWCAGSALTQAEQIALANAVHDYLVGIGSETYPAVIVCDGNSLTFGTPLGGASAYPHVMSGSLTTAGTKNVGVNKGVPSQTIALMAAGAATGVDPFASLRGTQKVLVAWELRNSMYVDGLTAAQAVDALQAYCVARRAAGFDKIVVVNTKPDNAYANTWQNGSWTTVNTELAGRWASFADALVDLSLIANLQNPLDTTYFQADTIHLTAAGYALVAGAVQTAVAGVL